jgi:hypothetical protein
MHQRDNKKETEATEMQVLTMKIYMWRRFIGGSWTLRVREEGEREQVDMALMTRVCHRCRGGTFRLG